MSNPKHIELLEQSKAHYAADMLDSDIRCIENKHKIVADYYQYPEWLAHLQDTIFEGLPEVYHSNWHVELAEAIASRNGKIDWKETLHRVHIGILRHAYRSAGSAKDAVQNVIALHERALNGENLTDGDWLAASAAAWSSKAAAWSSKAAAWSASAAAWLAAAKAASARSAEAAAKAASARSAEAAAKAASARSAAYQEIRDIVLEAIRVKGETK